MTKLIVRETSGWPWSTFKNLCKRLRDAKVVDEARIRTEIEELESEFERSDRYYFDPERWRSVSRPLMSEFIHTALSLSDQKGDCLEKVDELVAVLKKAKPKMQIPDFAAELKQEWARQGRP